MANDNQNDEDFLVADFKYKDLEVLPEIPAGTTHLFCNGNNLTVLPALPEGLKVVFCGHNKLTALPALPSTLRKLDCGNNKIDSLPELPVGLEELFCGGNPLTVLPALPEGLVALDIYKSNIEELPRVLPPRLEILSVAKTPITTIPKLPETLQLVDFDGTELDEPFQRLYKNYKDSFRFNARTQTEYGNLREFLREVNKVPREDGEIPELRVKRSNYPQNVITLEPFADGEKIEVMYSQEQFNQLSAGRNVSIKPSMVIKRQSARNLSLASANGRFLNPSTREPVAHREVRVLKFIDEAPPAPGAGNGSAAAGAGAGQEGGKKKTRHRRGRNRKSKRRQTRRRRRA